MKSIRIDITDKNDKLNLQIVEFEDCEKFTVLEQIAIANLLLDYLTEQCKLKKNNADENM